VRLIQEYNDSRILLVTEDKRGVAYARNVGISKAKGKFLALMDADDKCEIYRIQRQVEFFANNNVDIVGSYVRIIDENNKVLGIAKVPLDSNEIRKSVMICSPFFGSTPMLKREIVEDEKYDEAYPLASDYELYIRLISQGRKCYNIDEPLVQVRENSQSIMRSQYMRLNYYTIKARLKGILLGLRSVQDLIYFVITLPAIFCRRKDVLLAKRTVGKLFSREIVS
jgi:glycosyltransferase involved in cell wall biosynthesis